MRRAAKAVEAPAPARIVEKKEGGELRAYLVTSDDPNGEAVASLSRAAVENDGGDTGTLVSLWRRVLDNWLSRRLRDASEFPADARPPLLELDQVHAALCRAAATNRDRSATIHEVMAALGMPPTRPNFGQVQGALHRLEKARRAMKRQRRTAEGGRLAYRPRPTRR